MGAGRNTFGGSEGRCAVDGCSGDAMWVGVVGDAESVYQPDKRCICKIMLREIKKMHRPISEQPPLRQGTSKKIGRR